MYSVHAYSFAFQIDKIDSLFVRLRVSIIGVIVNTPMKSYHGFTDFELFNSM